MVAFEAAGMARVRLAEVPAERRKISMLSQDCATTLVQ